MAAPKPPTTLRGVVDDQAFAGILTDALEHVPDMTWPLSVPVFAQMRRDPQLAAVLKSYGLLVLRARWQLNGAGCRPEAVKLVADDLGLPVAGVDTPGAARVRGVSWREHLRTASSLSLTYGHMGFAMKAEMRDGKARLVALAERMPHTIGEIHADNRTGEFLGVSQALTPETMRGTPEIRADQMVWYCHEREGTGWYGTSLMRPAYGPWLIKREMQRVLATSNRRFGMGVPTVEWAPGTLPSPQQHQAALDAVTAARVGDQSGLVMPPGAHLVLAGVTGSAPDTLGFIKWLDQQISGMALARFMDLGESSNGSRALGESFIDFFTLAVQTVADDIADTATRQIAARITAWNFGEDEPVPQITVGDVGSHEELTAEAMKALVDGRVLTVDPGLESYVRRRFRLPDREGPARPVVPPRREPTVAAAAPPPDPVDYARIQADYQQTVTALTVRWEAVSQELVQAITEATRAELASGMLVGLAVAAIPSAVIAGLSVLLVDALLDAAQSAAEGAAREASLAGRLSPDLGQGERARLRQIADATVQVIVSGYTTGAAREALRLAGSDLDVDAVTEAVRQHLTDLSQAKEAGWVRDNLAAAVVSAQAVGRQAVMEQMPPGTRFRASERLDANTCGPCREADGREYDGLAAAVADYPAGKYIACEGRSRCRGLFFPIPAAADD